MEVIKVGDKHQVFNGESYYLCGCYYQHKGKRLHRAVWEYHNGKIPKGYHIHHIDEDRNNNDISNLEMLSAFDHLSKHGKEEKNREISRQNMKRAIAKAAEWHKSPEAHDFHSWLGRQSWKDREPITYTCDYCGKAYQSLKVYSEGSHHFCHNNCKAAFRRRRLRNEGCKCSACG